ncbi:hypothetical protein ACI6Q2_19680 [Chitinophagaceae bacterium LWZ2-11]
MKYSQQIGVIAALVLIVCCYLPWCYIESRQLTITGLNTGETNFGKPGLMHIFLSSIMILFFLFPRVWAKRTNIFLAAFNLAWSIKNYILVSTCMAGECPQKKFALYLLIASSVTIILMTFLPPMKPANNVKNRTA